MRTEGQIARFYEPICVVSEGLATNYKIVVEARVQELARAADIGLDRRSDPRPA